MNGNSVITGFSCNLRIYLSDKQLDYIISFQVTALEKNEKYKCYFSLSLFSIPDKGGMVFTSK